MKLTSTILFLLLALSACGIAPTPQPTVDTNATMNSISSTMVAGTLTARPTATARPTDTPTITPTDTPVPFTDTPTSTETATTPPTFTAAPFIGTLAPAGLNGTLPTKTFLIENHTKYTLRVSIYGVSSPGEKPVYYEYEVTGNFHFNIVWGNFQYTVMVGDKSTFTGNFRINNYDKTTMRVYNNQVLIIGP